MQIACLRGDGYRLKTMSFSITIDLKILAHYVTKKTMSFSYQLQKEGLRSNTIPQKYVPNSYKERISP